MKCAVFVIIVGLTTYAALPLFADACPDEGDAMDTSWGACTGLGLGSCTYYEGEYPVGCQPLYNYSCENGPVRDMMIRHWGGKCSFFSLRCSGTTSGSWIGPIPTIQTLSQPCPTRS